MRYLRYFGNIWYIVWLLGSYRGLKENVSNKIDKRSHVIIKFQSKFSAFRLVNLELSLTFTWLS